ncbi:DUF6157 family protein [Sphingobacterium hungaricum]|uniref:Uncharacterized protein n=1 Tax=Sphingobacterium hungaricum TaxID=2082723 RepID=A0A928YPB7_9SPHI|nr:DUF6157 family protein [Sphingobacterium hungaricum]MBE8712769.1 hypothetical protein [Sphingobacterium hungaricum]
MKKHTTDYFNTLIEVSEDCPAGKGEKPPVKMDKPTIANFQFDQLINHPYQFTSDELLFQQHVRKNDIAEANLDSEKEKFFSKGQPCLRTSALAKRYGWGIHYDENGKIALYPRESERYQQFASDVSISKVKAMKSSK